jgi:hypothetical protein
VEILDRAAPRAFLLSAFRADDTVAVFLKSYGTGAVAQRVVSRGLATSDRFLAWLRALNAARWNVYVCANAVDGRLRSRARRAVVDVRHLFVEADANAGAFLAAIAHRADLPQPSYLLRTSPGRAHVLWRVRGMDVCQAEALQKALARELGGDTAATSCAQTTRIPGFLNHKRATPHPVTMLFGPIDSVYGTQAFPPRGVAPRERAHSVSRPASLDGLARAKRYLESVPPAVAGTHGDSHTFKVCCRVVRGFDLDDESAIAALLAWNARCEPPWSETELRRKVRGARLYGREPIGGRLLSADGLMRMLAIIVSHCLPILLTYRL